MKYAALVLWVALIPAPATSQILELAELNTRQITSLDRAKTVFIIPGGILEEHGPYLPSFSDGYNNTRLALRLAEAIVARPGWAAVMFPVIPLGSGGANEIGGKNVFAGTYAIRSGTLRAIFMDLANELGEQGFRWILVVHGHGAPRHMAALDQAAGYFNDTYGGAMVNLLGLRSFGACFEAGKELVSAEQQREDGFTVHAGAEEHSLLLYLRPDLVPATIRRATPVTATSFADLIRLGAESDWPGYFGSPRLATAVRGARVFEACAQNVVSTALKILDGLDPRGLPRSAEGGVPDSALKQIIDNALAYEQQVETRQKEWLRMSGLLVYRSGENVTKPGAEAERQVIDTVYAVGQAWAEHDVAALERLVAADYSHTDFTGRVQNRDEWLADVRSSDTVHRLEFDDLDVRIHGDVAVVTGRIMWRVGTTGTVSLPLRFTQVLTKKNGYWQGAIFQAGIAEFPRYQIVIIVMTTAASFTLAWILLWLRNRLFHRWRRAEI